MESSNCYSSEPSRHQHLVGFAIGREHCPPAPSGSRLHVGVTSGHENSEDVERDETAVCDEGKEVVTGGASCWSRLGITEQVVDAVQGNSEIHTRLVMLAVFRHDCRMALTGTLMM